MIYTIEFHEVSVSAILRRADIEQQKEIFESGKNAKCIEDIVASIEKEKRAFFYSQVSKNDSFQYLENDTFEVSFFGDYSEKELTTFLMSLSKKQIVNYCISFDGLKEAIEDWREKEFLHFCFSFGEIVAIGGNCEN
jgi:hypothetical protein